MKDDDIKIRWFTPAERADLWKSSLPLFMPECHEVMGRFQIQANLHFDPRGIPDVAKDRLMMEQNIREEIKRKRYDNFHKRRSEVYRSLSQIMSLRDIVLTADGGEEILKPIRQLINDSL